MKDIDTLNEISDYLSTKSPYYRKLNTMHKEMNPWVKAAHGLAVVSLAVNGACQKIGLVTPSTETAVPDVHETLQPTEIPSTPEITPGIGEVQFLGQAEVLAIPVARTSGGELIPLSIFFESSFKQNLEISGLFDDPSSIKFSAMGIKVYSSKEKRTIVYPFLSAVSEKEQKGFTAMVLVPSPGVVVAPILNRIVDSDGKVGLGITQDIYNPEVNLKEPIIVFATGLTEAQIADMTIEELAKIDIFFIPAGVKVPYENISGGKANAIMAPITPEAPQAVDENDLHIIESSIHPVDVEFMGAQIVGSLQVDDSLSRSNPAITDISLPENVAAEYFARSIYRAWEKDHPGETFETYMQWISEVQAGKRDPMDIAFAAFANNLKDGKPYKDGQEKYLFVPWYSGQVPTEFGGLKVRVFGSIDITFVNGDRVKNIDNLGLSYAQSLGTNLDNDHLNIYVGLAFGSLYPNRPQNIASMMSLVPSWLSRSSEKAYPKSENKTIINLLVDGGLTVYPPPRE